MSEAWCDDLAVVIRSAYGIAAECRYVRRGFNEHFRAVAADAQQHVRVYLDGKYYIGGDDDLRFELALTSALADAGCAVAAPIPRTDGELLTLADVAGRARRLALFEVAPGTVKAEPTVDDLRRFVGAVARIHSTIDEVAPTLPGDRYHLDERYLLEQPLAQLRRVVPEAVEASPLPAAVDELAGMLASLPKDTSDYGIIHGDLHLGNVHVDDDDGGRLTIFDFDHCAHGWRAYDLAPIRMSLPDERWDEVLAAYESVRPLPPGVERIDDLVRVRTLWDIGDLLTMEAVWGTDEVTKQVPDALPQLLQRIVPG